MVEITDQNSFLGSRNNVYLRRPFLKIGPSLMLSLVKLHMSYLLTCELQHVDGEERKVMTDRRIRRSRR